MPTTAEGIFVLVNGSLQFVVRWFQLLEVMSALKRLCFSNLCRDVIGFMGLEEELPVFLGTSVSKFQTLDPLVKIQRKCKLDEASRSKEE
jgi:hypothetical protein